MGAKRKYKIKINGIRKEDLKKNLWTHKTRDGTWRIKTNEELNRLTKSQNIINYIKAQRLAWFGHVHRMPDDRMVKKIYEWTPMLTRSQGRPKTRWEDDVKNDVETMGLANGRTASRVDQPGKE